MTPSVLLFESCTENYQLSKPKRKNIILIFLTIRVLPTNIPIWITYNQIQWKAPVKKTGIIRCLYILLTPIGEVHNTVKFIFFSRGQDLIHTLFIWIAMMPTSGSLDYSLFGNDVVVFIKRKWSLFNQSNKFTIGFKGLRSWRWVWQIRPGKNARSRPNLRESLSHKPKNRARKVCIPILNLIVAHDQRSRYIKWKLMNIGVLTRTL